MNNINSDVDSSDEVIDAFMNSLFPSVKVSVIWYVQKNSLRTQSVLVYKVCHLRETTDKSNIVKLLMNYCPMEHVPEQLEWGHEKEIAASI